MKSIKKHAKSMILLLALFMLFQSCRAYYRDSVTLDQAVVAKKNAKIETIGNQTFKFKYIVKENDNYYGVEKLNGQLVKTLIIAAKVENVKLKNYQKSTVLSILSILGLCATVVAMIGLGSGSLGPSGSLSGY